jgi:SAM-dependent methyltransferase
MIETTIPEIDVTELMKRIRAEAARVTSVMAQNGGSQTSLSPLPPPPAISAPKNVDPRREKLESLLQQAREKTEVLHIPKPLRRFFRKQGAFNRLLLEAAKGLIKNDAGLNQLVGDLGVGLLAQNEWLKVNAGHLASIRNMLAAIHAHLSDVQAQISGADQRIDALGDRLAAKDAEASTLSELTAELRTQGERAGQHLRNLQAESDRLGLNLKNLQSESANTNQALTRLQLGLQSRATQHELLQAALNQLEERLTNDSVYIKGELSQQARIVRQSLEGGPKLSKAAKSNTATDIAADHRFDAFYLSFENHFRGRRSEIKKRVAFYLPYLEATGAGQADRPILDLGCGRGEWLELLKEGNLESRGVDLNSMMVAQCRERALDVAEDDVLRYLRSLPDDSLGAITGFHIIEHLPFEVLVDLVAESHRALKPGGLVMFESPNCKNLVVGASNFHIDPTHRSPVFPETAQFILDTHGFERVELKYLSPVEATPFESKNPEATVLNELLYGPQDFAVIGYKPAPR